ncbi:hypothetical protein D9M68_918890 [compost metagenome]
MPAFLVRILARPQAMAARRHNRNGHRPAPASRVLAMTAMPTKATAAPASWKRLGRSPNSRKASAMVKNAWVCSTSELSPAGMPKAMEILRKP